MQLICTNCKETFERKRVKPSKDKFCCRECHVIWRRSKVKINRCKDCGKNTHNPKFCNRSCSASYNNKKYPKRLLEGECMECHTPIQAKRKYCNSCFKAKQFVDYDKVTLADLKNKRTLQPHSRIRALARNTYIKSGSPKKCKICGYSAFFHVCHIKGIKDFDPETPISTINSISNLVALCPNHHTEFDANLVTL